MGIYWVSEAAEKSGPKKILVTTMNHKGPEWSIFMAVGRFRGWKSSPSTPELLGNEWLVQPRTVHQIRPLIDSLRQLMLNLAAADRDYDVNPLMTEAGRDENLIRSVVSRINEQEGLNLDVQTVQIGIPEDLSPKCSLANNRVKIREIIDFLEHCLKMGCGFHVRRTNDACENP